MEPDCSKSFVQGPSMNINFTLQELQKKLDFFVSSVNRKDLKIQRQVSKSVVQA